MFIKRARKLLSVTARRGSAHAPHRTGLIIRLLIV